MIRSVWRWLKRGKVKPLPLAHTARGFLVGEFNDLYGRICSIQKSSLAEQDAIWLGCGEQRAHLDQAMAAALLPHLEHFVETGELPEPK